MSTFNIKAEINKPHPEHGEYGNITIRSDLIIITSLIREGYKIAVLVDFEGLENKITKELSKVSNESINKQLLNQIPYAQIELKEQDLEFHSKSVGMILEKREGFNPQDGELIEDENGIQKFGNFKRYRVHLSEGSHLYLQTNIAFELAQCLDAFNKNYETFKNQYHSDVYRFSNLDIGDIFFDSIREDFMKSFVKLNISEAQLVDHDSEVIEGLYQDFDANYKVLKGKQKIDLSTLGEFHKNEISIPASFDILIAQIQKLVKLAFVFILGFIFGKYFS